MAAGYRRDWLRTALLAFVFVANRISSDIEDNKSYLETLYFESVPMTRAVCLEAWQTQVLLNP